MLAFLVYVMFFIPLHEQVHVWIFQLYDVPVERVVYFEVKVQGVLIDVGGCVIADYTYISDDVQTTCEFWQVLWEKVSFSTSCTLLLASLFKTFKKLKVFLTVPSTNALATNSNCLNRRG